MPTSAETVAALTDWRRRVRDLPAIPLPGFGLPPIGERHHGELVAAMLAAGIIAASGKPHSPAEALATFRDVLAERRRQKPAAGDPDAG